VKNLQATRCNCQSVIVYYGRKCSRAGGPGTMVKTDRSSYSSTGRFAGAILGAPAIGNSTHATLQS
jgi:hypothetical protein